MVKAWASREIFFQGDKVGEPITSLETQLRIKLMMHYLVTLKENFPGGPRLNHVNHLVDGCVASMVVLVV